MDLKTDLNVEAFEPAYVVRPCRGEFVSGDAAVVRPGEGGCFVAIVDVLGHGPEAHDVAGLIEAFLERHGGSDVADVMSRLHERLRGSRGAAVGLCWIADSGELRYAGTGNTALRRFGEVETRLVSRDGVLGQTLRTPREERLELQPGDLVVLYTDGVSDRFGLDDYPGLLHHEASYVARTVVERFGKDHDDAACVAVRYRP